MHWETFSYERVHKHLGISKRVFEYLLDQVGIRSKPVYTKLEAQRLIFHYRTTGPYKRSDIRDYELRRKLGGVFGKTSLAKSKQVR